MESKNREKDKRRVAVLGGTFDPAHVGHLSLSLYCLNCLQADEVWWSVQPTSFKKVKHIFSLSSRINFAYSLAQHSAIKVFSLEQKYSTVYSVDTMQTVVENYPHYKFIFILGQDNLANMHTWYKWKKLLTLLPVVVFNRQGSRSEVDSQLLQYLVENNMIFIVGDKYRQESSVYQGLGLFNYNNAVVLRGSNIWSQAIGCLYIDDILSDLSSSYVRDLLNK